MEQFMGMFGLPRHITWTVGFAAFLFVLALVSTALRKRSQIWAATSVQAWLGFVVMAAVAALVFATMPSDFYTEAAKLAGK